MIRKSKKPMNSAWSRRAKETKACTLPNRSVFQSLKTTSSTSEKRKWRKTFLRARWANFRLENRTHRIVMLAVEPASVKLPSPLAETTISATVLTPRLVDDKKNLIAEQHCGVLSILRRKSVRQCAHQLKEDRIALKRRMGLQGPLFPKSTLSRSHQNAWISNLWSLRTRRTVT